MSTQRSIAVIGAGYWGPNLVRNFRNNPEWDLVAVCDLDEARARKVIGNRSTVDVESSVARLLSRKDIDAVAIATPARTHAPLALAAFEAGKHVLVEKPLADDAAHAADMVEAAERADRVLMIDHTYCYTPAVAYIREAVALGTLGEILVCRFRPHQPRAGSARCGRLLGPRSARLVDLGFHPSRRLGPRDDLSDRLRSAGRR